MVRRSIALAKRRSILPGLGSARVLPPAVGDRKVSKARWSWPDLAGDKTVRAFSEAEGDRHRRYAACPGNRTSTASGCGFRHWSRPGGQASGSSFRQGSRPCGNNGRIPRGRPLPGWRTAAFRRVRHHHWLPRCGTICGHRAAHPQETLHLDIGIEQPAVLAPRKGEPQGEAFVVQLADGPAHIRRGHADESVRGRSSRYRPASPRPGAGAGRNRWSAR